MHADLLLEGQRGAVRAAGGAWGFDTRISKQSSPARRLFDAPHPQSPFCQREVLTSLSGCLWGLEVTQETWFLPCRSGTQKHYYKHWHYFISIIVDLTFLQHLFTSTFGILVFDTKKATWYSVLLSQGLVQSSQLPGICITFILSIMKTYFYFLCI